MGHHPSAAAPAPLSKSITHQSKRSEEFGSIIGLSSHSCQQVCVYGNYIFRVQPLGGASEQTDDPLNENEADL